MVFPNSGGISNGFTHLSERDRFFGFHNKLKNINLNQMQI